MIFSCGRIDVIKNIQFSHRLLKYFTFLSQDKRPICDFFKRHPWSRVPCKCFQKPDELPFLSILKQVCDDWPAPRMHMESEWAEARMAMAVFRAHFSSFHFCVLSWNAFVLRFVEIGGLSTCSKLHSVTCCVQDYVDVFTVVHVDTDAQWVERRGGAMHRRACHELVLNWKLIWKCKQADWYFHTLWNWLYDMKKTVWALLERKICTCSYWDLVESMMAVIRKKGSTCLWKRLQDRCEGDETWRLSVKTRTIFKGMFWK